MLDTKGPEYRIKTFKDGKITLTEGDRFTFTTEDIIGDKIIITGGDTSGTSGNTSLIKIENI